MQNLLAQVMRMLNSRASIVPKDLRDQAQLIASHQREIAARFDAFLRCRLTIERMRIHGDLHLGQILYTGRDFAIIDFEGEPARPLSERRLKRAAIERRGRDAAIVSLCGAYLDHRATENRRTWKFRFRRHGAVGELLADLVLVGVSERLSGSRRPRVRSLPKSDDELRILIDAFVMDKAIYELGYELNNRPDWLLIPLLSIGQLLGLKSDNAQHLIVPKPGIHESPRA